MVSTYTYAAHSICFRNTLSFEVLLIPPPLMLSSHSLYILKGVYISDITRLPTIPTSVSQICLSNGMLEQIGRYL